MHTKHKVVLVPTDFTEMGEYATDHAIGICKHLHYSAHLLHVINRDTKTKLKKEKKTEDTVFQKLEHQVKHLLDTHNVKADYSAVEGSIFTTIAEVAENVDANLIVMGTHGKVGMQQQLLGSFAFKVITSAPDPVIVVQKRKFGEGYKNIVLPVDDSLESKQKVKWAAHIGHGFKSTVHLFGAYSSDEFIMRKIKANMRQISGLLAENHIETTETFAGSRGSMSRQVVKFAHEKSADLIIIMTKPDKSLHHYIVKPGDEIVIFNDSRIPVMCVNPKSVHINVVRF